MRRGARRIALRVITRVELGCRVNTCTRQDAVVLLLAGGFVVYYWLLLGGILPQTG